MNDFSLERINDPIFSTYSGLVTPKWASSSFHQFEAAIDNADPTKISLLYFDPLTLGYRYEWKKSSIEVSYSEKGFVEATFTHADYAAYESCSPTPYFLAESAPAPAPEEIL